MLEVSIHGMSLKITNWKLHRINSLLPEGYGSNCWSRSWWGWGWGYIGFTLSVRLSPMPCPLCGSLPISWIIFICSTNTTMREWCVMYHFQVNRSKVKVMGHLNFGPCRLHGSATLWRICFIYGINTTYECRCVTYHFQVNRSKVKVTRVFQILGHVSSMAHCICLLEVAFRVTYNVEISELFVFAVGEGGILIDRWCTISGLVW